MLQGKTIIVGITGGIAAYKACEVVSRLKKFGAEVWVVMTREAQVLVGPLTFRTLSGNPVVTDLFSPDLSSLPVPHIALAKKADLLLIVPATANLIGKIAGGIADDALTTIVMAAPCPKLIAPAMNSEMWNNPLVAENCAKLKQLGFNFIGPEIGFLACGDDDIGRMSEPEEIVAEVISLLGGSQDFKGKHILITAGGTREAIDSVRFISNRSSGKMGYAIAGAARERGAHVTLISANVALPSPLDIQPIKVESAGGMLEAVFDFYNNAKVIVMAAAVADYAPAKPQSKKIKKDESSLKLELEPTRDILTALSRQKGRSERQLVGFALETENIIENAKNKLKQKDLDLIVANGPSAFDCDIASGAIIDRCGREESFSNLPKSLLANRILDAVLRL
jgi:phosphopantothenoylcysteine decarboxylase/phosphopantothenate--cysteine ligase